MCAAEQKVWSKVEVNLVQMTIRSRLHLFSIHSPSISSLCPSCPQVSPLAISRNVCIETRSAGTSVPPYIVGIRRVYGASSRLEEGVLKPKLLFLVSSWVIIAPCGSKGYSAELQWGEATRKLVRDRETESTRDPPNCSMGTQFAKPG
jgi:hypothetical protein